jgi:hypothetical protein
LLSGRAVAFRFQDEQHPSDSAGSYSLSGWRQDVAQFLEHSADRRFVRGPKDNLTLAGQLAEAAEPTIVNQQMGYLCIPAGDQAGGTQVFQLAELVRHIVQKDFHSLGQGPLIFGLEEYLQLLNGQPLSHRFQDLARVELPDGFRLPLGKPLQKESIGLGKRPIGRNHVPVGQHF